jgi:DNA-binding NarL/FixJ family response regulator
MEERVLIVDDHASFRSIARRLLVAAGFEVVGEAGDGAEAIAAARDLLPDVVLLDIRLPDLDGFQVAAVMAAQVRAPAVVLISSRARTDFGDRVTSSGVRGFIAKQDLSGEALVRVLEGPGRSPG